MSKVPWRWLDHTEPFSAIGEVRKPAHFVVEQISDKDFRLPAGTGFQYNPDGEAPITVTPTTLPSTDFASIPRYMSWLVSRYGRHTPAALVHDRLVVDGMPFEDRKHADRRFLTMMDDLDVPPVLSRVMWSAVTLATRLGGPAAVRTGMVAWGAAALAGIGLLTDGIVAGHPGLIVVALVAPAPAALLWGNQFWAGLVGGYALPVVALPALASVLGYWAYWIIEQGVRIGRKGFAHNRGAELPRPIGYQGR